MNFTQFAAEEGWSRTVRSDDALAEDTLVEELDRHIAYHKQHAVSADWKTDAQDLNNRTLSPTMDARKALETVTNSRAVQAAYAAVNLTREQRIRQAKNRLTERYAIDFAALRRETLGR